MADNETLYQWLCGGYGAAMLGGFSYLMSAIGKTTDAVDKTNADLSAHKTLVAEKYLTKDDFNSGISTVREDVKRVERRMEDGNKANLDSNEKIRSEQNVGYNTLATMISNSGKISNEVNAVLAAVNANKGG